MKKEVYHIREYRDSDKGNHRVGTVCIAMDEKGKFHRGVAVASIDEPFNQVKGRDKATGRCEKAMSMERCDDVMNMEGDRSAVLSLVRMRKALEGSDKFFVNPYKSAYDVVPTAFERNLLDEKQQSAPISE